MLTTDRATLINLMKEVQTDLIEDGTAIGNGLATAVARMKDSDAKSRVIILLTDGVNNRGEVDPAMAAEIAKTYGIRVYTIGVGKEGEAPYPVMTPWGPDVQNMKVEIDEPLLKQIAAETGGKYFRANRQRQHQAGGDLQRDRPDGEDPHHRGQLPHLQGPVPAVRHLGAGVPAVGSVDSVPA